MRNQRNQPTEGRRKTLAGALVALLALIAASVLGTAGPALADVDSVSGSATPVFIGSTTLVPTVSGSASEPADGYGPIGSGLLGSGTNCPNAGQTGTVPVIVAPLLGLGLLDGCTQGAGVAGDNHLGFAESSAAVADLVLGGNNIGVVRTECRADGNGAVGSTTIVGSSTLPAAPLPNTPVTLPVVGGVGVLTLTLNEQTVSNVPGSATITVNGLHVSLLGIDIIIAQSTCSATGPDVNVATTVTTGGGNTTVTTGGGNTTVTTGGGNTTVTTGGSNTTATTGGSNTTATTNFSGVTTTPGGTTGGGSVVGGALARTGAFLSNAFVWGALILFLGGLALLGSKGEVQTWPPKRSSRRSHGPRRSGTTWPNNRGRSHRRFF
jgi:hypothetical protein